MKKPEYAVEWMTVDGLIEERKMEESYSIGCKINTNTVDWVLEKA